MDRSIVTITLKSDPVSGPFADAFWKSSVSGDISQSVSVLAGSQFSSWRLGERFYHVGNLPLWEQVRYWLRESRGSSWCSLLCSALLSFRGSKRFSTVALASAWKPTQCKRSSNLSSAS